MPEKKGEQGTGKHPHKSTEEPYPHTKESGREESEERGSSQRGAGTARAKEENKGNESSDLKEREYRDNQGNVHHHTRTYEEQHKNEKK